MRTVVYRLPLRRLQSRAMPANQQGSVAYHSTPASSFPARPALGVLEPLPELPPTPKYPCPFLTEPDVEQYLAPLYLSGWGISRIPATTSDAKTRPPATQLSKRIVLPNPDIAEIFMKDVATTIIEQENHHPTLEKEGVLSNTILHVHTHSALAPLDRQNADDYKTFARKRPGITHRDIRFAILVEQLLRDYIRGRFLDPQPTTSFSQPTGIDTVHNFRALPTEIRDSK